jgi:hypothetical protein
MFPNYSREETVLAENISNENEPNIKS